jgi:hypothetical protein
MLTTWRLYPQKLALTSPAIGGRSVDIVRSRSQTMEFESRSSPIGISSISSITVMSSVRELNFLTVCNADMQCGEKWIEFLYPSLRTLCVVGTLIDLNQSAGSYEQKTGTSTGALRWTCCSAGWIHVVESCTTCDKPQVKLHLIRRVGRRADN